VYTECVFDNVLSWFSYVLQINQFEDNVLSNRNNTNRLAIGCLLVNKWTNHLRSCRLINVAYIARKGLKLLCHRDGRLTFEMIAFLPLLLFWLNTCIITSCSKWLVILQQIKHGSTPLLIFTQQIKHGSTPLLIFTHKKQLIYVNRLDRIHFYSDIEQTHCKISS